LAAFFLDFLKKIKKKGSQTLFYFAAGGGEILVIHPHFLHNPFLWKGRSSPAGLAEDERPHAL
jgi:hypothetical protein